MWCDDCGRDFDIDSGKYVGNAFVNMLFNVALIMLLLILLAITLSKSIGKICWVIVL